MKNSADDLKFETWYKAEDAYGNGDSFYNYFWKLADRIGMLGVEIRDHGNTFYVEGGLVEFKEFAKNYKLEETSVPARSIITKFFSSWGL